MSEANFKKFCTSTSAHGFSHFNAPSKHVKFFWLVILILALVAESFHLYTIVREYLDYNYHETIVTSTDIYPEFPDVTLCDNSGLSEASLAK